MSKKLTTEEFIVKARKVHGNDYDYSLVEYVNTRTKVKIICNECGHIFEQTPNSHLSGRGCPVDGAAKRVVHRSNTEEFIAKAREVHGNDYDYSLVEYVNNCTKVKIICNECGYIFEQTPNSHLSGKGCPRCNESKGEKFIDTWLTMHDVDCIRQYKNDKCKNKRALPFDFAIFTNDELKLIEFQGKHHYMIIPYSIKRNPAASFTRAFNNYIRTQRHDQIKQTYCQQNNIPLLIIPYWLTDKEITQELEAFVRA